MLRTLRAIHLSVNSRATSLRYLATMAESAKLKLYTVGTPNGHKPSILLEELKAAYGLQYEFQGLSFAKNEQKEDWFLKINPNGRIPALTDSTSGKPHHVFESASILLWLVENYDPEFKFSFQDPFERSQALSWIFFVHGGVGPMQGQANHFFRYAPEKIPYGIKRYQDETNRLYSVLESRLQEDGGRDYLVGAGKGKYSIADINAFPWVRSWEWAGVGPISKFPAVEAWLSRIDARPGVKAGRDVPEKQREQPLTEEEKEAKAKEARDWIFKEQNEKKQ